jgi:hypothetical protein
MVCIHPEPNEAARNDGSPASYIYSPLKILNPALSPQILIRAGDIAAM